MENPHREISKMKSIELTKPNKEIYYYTEAIKKLRTNIQFSSNAVQVIAITSSFPSEGKSDVTFELAYSFSQIGKKVIVLDADIRKSVMVARLNVGQRTQGLSEYLSGQCGMDDIIYGTNFPNLDFVFAGRYSPSSADLLEGELLIDLIGSLRQKYDYIFVDTAPVVAVTDGTIVAKHCDGILLVIESGKTSYRVLQRVKEQLQTTGTKILGTVLNKVDEYQDSYYGRYGKFSKYGKYDKYGKYSRYEMDIRY